MAAIANPGELLLPRKHLIFAALEVSLAILVAIREAESEENLLRVSSKKIPKLKLEMSSILLRVPSHRRWVWTIAQPGWWETSGRAAPGIKLHAVPNANIRLVTEQNWTAAAACCGGISSCGDRSYNPPPQYPLPALKAHQGLVEA